MNGNRSIIVCSMITILVLILSLRGACAETPLTMSPEQKENAYKECFKKADYFLGKYDFNESIANCEAAIKYKTDDYLAHAIMCLDYYYIAEDLDVKKSDERSKKNKLYEKMIQVAEEGIRNAPDHGECYFMRGLAYARLATTKGILYSLFTAKGIEKDWLLAAKCKSGYCTPTGENLDASCNIALGSYYRLCPSFFMLKLIFGISGDPDKSVERCKTAFKLDPRIEVAKEYGVCLIARGLAKHNQSDIAEGKKYLQMVPSMPLKLKTDPVDIEHSKILLSDISLCPGYSRDQQQEISEKAYKKIQAENKKNSNS